MIQKSLIIAGIALIILVLGILPVSAEIQTIYPGATVFIGESGLDITRAVGNITTIAWWAPGADIYASDPAKVLVIGEYRTRYWISDREFIGHTGNWYQYDETRPNSAGPLAFTVADPTLDIQIIDADTQVDVTGKVVPPGNHLMFRIITNQYAAVDPAQRPNVNPATDGYVSVKVIDEMGKRYTVLYDTLATSHPLGNLTVDKADWRWGGSTQYSWNVDSTDGSNTRRYPYGVYSVSARSNLNGLSNNYKNAGSDYTGKTVSDTKAVIVNSPNPIVIEEKGISLVEQAAREKAAWAANKTQQPLNVIQSIPLPSPDPLAQSRSSAGSKKTSIMDRGVIIGNFTQHLESFNNVMDWNLTPEQINEYAVSMENGILKKYIYNPQYPEALDIPNKRQFYLEVGDALGFTQEESEEFVLAIEEYRRKEFGMLDCRSYGDSNTCKYEPIVINFSAKPRLTDRVNNTKPAITPNPALSCTSFFSEPFVTSGDVNFPSQNLTEIISKDSLLQGIVLKWDDVLKKVTSLFRGS